MHPHHILIRKLEIRDAVSPQEQRVLEDLLRPTTSIAKGIDFINPGDEPRHSTLLVGGLCARYSLGEDGRRQLTAIHVPGDFVDGS